MSTQWIPNFIRKSMNYKPNEILTAQEYNAILNLLIAQGDYNSEWLQYLQEDAIPEALQDLSAEAIAEAIGQAVQREIASLTASVTNKTSIQLNNPAVTILNVGLQYTGMSDLKTLLDSKNLHATYAAAVNLVGNNSAYPTIAQLLALKNDGNDIVAYGTDGTKLTPATAETVVNTAYNFMQLNGFSTDTFIYPLGNDDADIAQTVASKFNVAANVSNEALVDPAHYPLTAFDNFYDIPIITWNNTVDVEDIKGYIDTIVEENKYMILQINTDLSSYEETKFEQIVDYMLTKSSMEYPASIFSEAYKMMTTIGNRLAILEGVYTTQVDGEKYINW